MKIIFYRLLDMYKSDLCYIILATYFVFEPITFTTTIQKGIIFSFAIAAWVGGRECRRWCAIAEVGVDDGEKSKVSKTKNKGSPSVAEKFHDIIVAPIFEELFYRFALLQVLIIILDNLVAGCIISSLLFAYRHKHYGKHLLGIYFGKALIYCYFTLEIGIWYAILFHSINNLLYHHTQQRKNASC